MSVKWSRSTSEEYSLPTNSSNPFEAWLHLQRKLQITAFDVDPVALVGDARAQYATWNAYALVHELSETMDEIGWKPWATSRHLNREAFIGEVVDVLHFVGNLLLLAAENEDSSLEQFGRVINVSKLADDVWERYCMKHEKNIRRQHEGYDGVEGKCTKCGRELPRIQIPALGGDLDAWVYGGCPVHDA